MRWGLLHWAGIALAGFLGAGAMYIVTMIAPRWQSVAMSDEAIGAAVGAMLTIIGAQMVAKLEERRKAAQNRRTAIDLTDKMMTAIGDLRQAPDNDLGELVRLFSLAVREFEIAPFHFPDDAHEARVQHAALREDLDQVIQQFQTAFAVEAWTDGVDTANRIEITQPALQRLQRLRTML